jgi:glycosyltransferase involved in cell wall biosynthesis
MTTEEPMRVLHVSHFCLPHIGGLETVVAAETRRLAGRGHQVTLVSSACGAAPGDRTEDGVRTVRIRAWNPLERRSGVPFPLFSPRLLPALRRHVRWADVVHVHDPLYVSSWLAALWCVLLGTPYVVHRHVGFVHHSSHLVRMVQQVVLGSVGRMVLARAATVLAIDEPIAAATRARVGRPERVEVLGNGVDTSRFHPADPDEREVRRARFALPVEEPLVLFVGRFVPKKGYPLVAAAAGDDYRLVFVGGDRPHGLTDDRLIFLGALPADDLAEVYRCVDAFVVASVGECPLTVLEAMSSGLPVLANEDPALHSPWTAGTGVQFVDMSSGQLPAAIEGLLSDPARMRTMGAEARSHVQQAFSWDAHVDGLSEVYRKAVEAAEASSPG